MSFLSAGKRNVRKGALVVFFFLRGFFDFFPGLYMSLAFKKIKNYWGKHKIHVYNGN